MFLLRSTCRSCEGNNLEAVFSAGPLPLPEALLLPSQLEDGGRCYPLDVAYCHDCGLVQLLQTVPAADIYDDGFHHLSATSAVRVEHARALAEKLVHDRCLDGNSLVIEAGSNDGSMLQNFQARGVPTLGIEPAPVPAAEARRAGIATIPAFFSRHLATELASEGKRADVVLALNVLPLVPDLHGFLAGVRALLSEDGIAVFEVPYIRDIVETAHLQAISHEQLSYFSASTFSTLLLKNGLYPLSCERLDLNGGTLRITVGLGPVREPSLRAMLVAEAETAMDAIDYYRELERRAERIKLQMLGLLNDVKASGHSVVGYGSRATSMLTYCGLGDSYLDYVVDPNVQKQGRFLPAMKLPVLSPERLASNQPDYVLILDGSRPDDVIARHPVYRTRGGRFIVPGLEPAVV